MIGWARHAWIEAYAWVTENSFHAQELQGGGGAAHSRARDLALSDLRLARDLQRLVKRLVVNKKAAFERAWAYC